MGFGGALIWSGLARNLRERHPWKPVIFVYNASRESVKNKIPHPDHEVYANNPDIFRIIPRPLWNSRRWFYPKWIFQIVDMGNPAYYYWDNDTAEKIFYKTGRHAIQIACDMHGIADAQLSPVLIISKEETAKVQGILQARNLSSKHFICIEPHFKASFTPNKAWFWDRWQEFVKSFHQYLREQHLDIQLVQVGKRTDEVLDGVIDMTGIGTFREVAGILKESLFFISYMGGLIHLSKAVGTRNVVLISSWEPKELASYPDDINLYTDIDCRNCGLKIPCPIERQCMQRITVDMVFGACQTLLDEEYGKYA